MSAVTSEQQCRNCTSTHWPLPDCVANTFLIRSVLTALFVVVLPLLTVADDDEILFTPPGFDQMGHPKTAEGEDTARVTIVTLDKETGEQTPCRINVVGPDGNYYQPRHNYLSRFGLTGKWPEQGLGNREGKAPYRYFGRFFYSWGKIAVDVPAGATRIEVWKGFEYAPVSVPLQTEAGTTHEVTIDLSRRLKMPEVGYYSGDPHIHITQENQTDEQLILDLMQAEGIRHGTILAYNDPAGPYEGLMKAQDMPQTRGLGEKSIRTRDGFQIVSGQEYRSSTFGHLNLFFLDELVYPGADFNADDHIAYGLVCRKAREMGGFSIYAHGGYAQEIYADIVQTDVDAVELLQFGVYRGMGLDDWYHVLNTGYQFPIVGACDFPACRKLGDCKTYIYSEKDPTIKEYMQAATTGHSFVTTGPMLLLTVNNQQPGTVIELDEGKSIPLTVKIRLACEVAPVSDVQLIVDGKVHATKKLELRATAEGQWWEWETELTADHPGWIAARAFSVASNGQPDAESHTNPVYIHQAGKRPYQQQSLDVILSRIDGEIEKHKKRTFAEKADILAYFNHSRDLLLKIRQLGGFPAGVSPRQFAENGREEISNPGARAHTEAELKAYLKPIPPVAPEIAIDHFETDPKFEMQLVAAEPMVYDPIAACFDEQGQMFVCEMRDYPYFPQPGDKPIGTVRLLRDTDHDDQFDESHLFADELLWAAGVTPWNGGVYVAAPPDIWYLKDTTGDYKADVRERVYSGFGTENQQAMLNNLQWGLDHHIYGSTAGNGGTITSARHPETPPVSVNGQDFRFSPVTDAFEAITGTIQFGNTFDDWGNRFLCSESSPLHHVVLPQNYLTRNPQLQTPRGINNIAGYSVPIFRISPVERWRQIRSSRRIAHNERLATSAGASHHVVDAAAGVTIYRGGAYPPEYYGNVFIGDAQNNLVHRRQLQADGVTFTSQRVEEKTEFVRSPDNWFRPVNFVNAPDGTLYVVDMSREILESIHIPLDVVKFLDLKSGRRNGRIYRIAPKGFQSPSQPYVDAFRDENLVSQLSSPHGWWRDTAHRLIYQRQSPKHVEPLRQLLATSENLVTRLHALWSLAGLNALDEQDLLTALGDSSEQVRRHAIQLTEPWLDHSEQLLAPVVALANDESAIVRFQVAFSLGESQHPTAIEGLATIASRDLGDSWIRSALLSSVSKTADRLFLKLIDNAPFAQQAESENFLAMLAKVVGGSDQPEHVADFLNLLLTRPELTANANKQSRSISELGQGLKLVGSHLPTQTGHAAVNEWLTTQLQSALALAANKTADEARRIAAIGQLILFDPSLSEEALTSCLAASESAEIQIAALNALSESSSAEIPQHVIEGWGQFLPKVREAALNVLLSRDAWAEQLLRSALNSDVDLAVTTQLQRQALTEHRNNSIRQLALQLFGAQVNQNMETVIASYQSSISNSGDLEIGHKLFRENCATCHKIGDEGIAVGPDLTSTSNKEPAALLTHILDPNRYILPNFVQYIIVDVGGKTHTGLIAAQSATSITLKQEKGASVILLRSQIEEIVATGKSLMPEGFEKKIPPPQMQHLIAFLQKSHIPASDNKPLDVGTIPGLVEPPKQ